MSVAGVGEQRSATGRTGIRGGLVEELGSAWLLRSRKLSDVASPTHL